MWYELTRGLAYQRIEHPSIGWYNKWMPLLLAVLASACYIALPAKPPLIAGTSLSNSILGLVSTLPGFYLAALAASATFDRPGMDSEIPEPAPKLNISTQGSTEKISLTRRMFLTYMFAYLTLLSLLICGLLILSSAALPTVILLLKEIPNDISIYISFILKVLFVFINSTLLFSLSITTLHGIYFLCEKIHQPQ